MTNVVLGIDLGKNVCSLVGLDARGAVVLRRRRGARASWSSCCPCRMPLALSADGLPAGLDRSALLLSLARRRPLERGERHAGDGVAGAGGARGVADGRYAGEKLRGALKGLGGWSVEIIKRSDTAKGFEVLPRRWVVERTLDWLGRCRRLAKDWEASIASLEAWATVAHIRMLTRRLARYCYV